MTIAMPYTRTHPWLRFTADFDQATPQFWMMLGECAAKCAAMAQFPLRPGTSKKLAELHTARAVHAITSVESWRLSEDEVRGLLSGRHTLPPSRDYLRREVENVLTVYRHITSETAVGGRIALTLENLGIFNRAVLHGLELEPGVVPGQLREHALGEGAHRGVPPQDCKFVLERLCEWLNGTAFRAPDGFDPHSPVLAIPKAVIAHLYLLWILPFGAGNRRTARLVEVMMLANAGLPAPALHLLSVHYNQTRDEYARRLEAAGPKRGGVVPFIEYALRGFLDEIDAQLSALWRQQQDMTWWNFIYETFRDKTRPSDHRKKRLVLDLAAQEQLVPVNRLAHLSPRVAESYANRTSRTLARDIDDLIEMGLVVRTDAGVRARKEAVMAFLRPQPKAASGKRPAG